MLSRQQFTGGAFAAAATIGARRPAEAAEFTLKFANNLDKDHPLNVRCTDAFSSIRKKTNGAVDVRSFPNSQLGSDNSVLGQLRSGAIEILGFPGAFLTILPIASIENVAFAFHDRDTVFRALDGDLGALIQSAINGANLVPMRRVFENGFRSITTSNKPIRNVADLQGLKIRVSPGKIRVDTFSSLGASPTPIAVAELYTALETHVVDAEENALVNIETQRFFEVQHYLSLSRHMWGGYWILFNGDAWRRLPAKYQAIIESELDAAALHQRRDIGLLDGALQDKLRRRGLAVNEVDTASFRAKLRASGYYSRWRDEFGSRAWSTLEKYSGRLA